MEKFSIVPLAGIFLLIFQTKRGGRMPDKELVRLHREKKKAKRSGNILNYVKICQRIREIVKKRFEEEEVRSNS